MIDWNHFSGLCARGSYFYKSRSQGLSEMYRGYIENGLVEEEDAARWSLPAEHQPSTEARESMLQVMEIQLWQEDRSHHFASMEGDYCGWAINIAGRMERGEPLTPGDLWFVATQVVDRDGSHLLQREDDLWEEDREDGRLEDHIENVWKICQSVVRLFPEIELYLNHGDNIFSTVLC